MTPATRLGFIGLGHLGSWIAQRLLTAGFPVTIFNRDREKTKELAALGADVAPDPRTLATASMWFCLASLTGRQWRACTWDRATFCALPERGRWSSR